MANIAQGKQNNIPGFLRFILNLMGPKGRAGDLLSFLLFEPEYTRELIELGYQDTLKSAAMVTAFFD